MLSPLVWVLLWGLLFQLLSPKVAPEDLATVMFTMLWVTKNVMPAAKFTHLGTLFIKQNAVGWCVGKNLLDFAGRRVGPLFYFFILKLGHSGIGRTSV